MERDRRIGRKEEDTFATIIQPIINAIVRVGRYHQRLELNADTPPEVVTYYQQVEQMLEETQALMGLLSVKETPNDRIGRYLVEAKKEADAIVAEAKKDALAYVKLVQALSDETHPPKRPDQPALRSGSHLEDILLPSNLVEGVEDTAGFTELAQVERDRLQALEDLQVFLDQM